MTVAPQFGRAHRSSPLRAAARPLCALGLLGGTIGAVALFAGAPVVLASAAGPLAAASAAALAIGLALAAAGVLDQRLIETEATLIETREQLKAALIALERTPAGREPDKSFRSRPKSPRARRFG